MLERWREQVPEANLGFGRSGLLLYTFGQCQWHLGRARVGGYQTQQRSLRAGETRAHFTLVHSNGKMVQASSDHRPTCPPIASSTTPLLRSAWELTGILYMLPPGGAGAQAHSGFRHNACHDFHRPVAEFTATRLASFPSVDDRGGRFSLLARSW